MVVSFGRWERMGDHGGPDSPEDLVDATIQGWLDDDASNLDALGRAKMCCEGNSQELWSVHYTSKMDLAVNAALIKEIVKAARRKNKVTACVMLLPPL